MGHTLAANQEWIIQSDWENLIARGNTHTSAKKIVFNMIIEDDLIM